MKNKEIHIGKTIRTICKQRGLALTEAAEEAGMTKQKFDYWLKKDDIPVKKLCTISKAVGYDFVALFVQPKEEDQEAKLKLQIEIPKDKQDEILKLIKDKSLYEILKNKTVNS